MSRGLTVNLEGEWRLEVNLLLEVLNSLWILRQLFLRERIAGPSTV